MLDKIAANLSGQPLPNPAMFAMARGVQRDPSIARGIGMARGGRRDATEPRADYDTGTVTERRRMIKQLKAEIADLSKGLPRKKSPQQKAAEKRKRAHERGMLNACKTIRKKRKAARRK